MVLLLNNNFVYRDNMVELLTDRNSLLFHDIFQKVPLGSSTTQTRTDTSCETLLLKRSSTSKSCWSNYGKTSLTFTSFSVFFTFCGWFLFCLKILWRGLLPEKSIEGELIKHKSQTEILSGQLPLNKGMHVMRTWNRCSFCAHLDLCWERLLLSASNWG